MASSHSTPIARRLGAGAAAALLLGSSLIVTAASAGSVLAALPSAGSVQVSAAVHHDVSPPLRGMAPASPSARKLTEQPIRLTGRTYPNMPDGALQGSATTFAATTAGIGFAGVGQGDYGFSDQYAPPDTNGAVGATQYVQWVNTAFAVFDKTTGTKILGPVAGNTLWSGFGGGCQTNNNGDPIVQYDKAAQRWILTQFSISTTPYLQCVAVSTTSDATGSYNRYAFSYGNTNFNDYPKLGVWPDGYYLSANIFLNGSSYAGPMVCAYNRTAMLAGAAATQQCFQISNSYGPVLPADLDGKQAPPAGTPEMFLGYGSSSLDLWKFHVDWTTPTNTKLSGPTVIPVASFSAACNGGTCIPQSGTSQKLDSLADRVMYRLAYRNFGDHEALVVNHSVTAGTSTGIRWYELRNAAGQTMASAAPVVNQQGTYAPDASYRWMGSIAMDGSGDIAVGYSVSSSSMFPSIAYASRVPGDAAGTLSTEVTVKAGGGSQLANLSRWGDYSAMTVDPVDDCTFWYTNEYLKASGTFNWSTWITSFKFPGCGVQQTLTSIAVSPASAKVLTGASQQYTATARDQSGNPMATQPAFTWSVNGGGSIGASGLFTAGSTAGGQFTVTATSGGVTGTASVTVTSAPPDFSLSVSSSQQSVKQGSIATFNVSITLINSFSGSVNLSVSGQPSGSTVTFTPNPASSTSTMTVQTVGGVRGAFTLTITGVSLSLSHKATATLTVTKH